MFPPEEPFEQRPKIKRTCLLMEDECAPDAFDTFNTELKKITGHSFQEFKNLAEDLSDDFSCIYKLGILTLESHADSPWWELWTKND